MVGRQPIVILAQSLTATVLEPRTPGRRPPMRRATAFNVGLWTTVPLLLIAGTGCSVQSDSGGCIPTEIEAASVSTDDPTERVVLSGRLTTEGKPIEGAEVQFMVLHTDESGELSGGVTGIAETDSEGLAELAYRGAKDLPAFSDETLVAYRAEYTSITDTAEYCSASSENATIDVPCAGSGCE